MKIVRRATKIQKIAAWSQNLARRYEDFEKHYLYTIGTLVILEFIGKGCIYLIPFFEKVDFENSALYSIFEASELFVQYFFFILHGIAAIVTILSIVKLIYLRSMNDKVPDI